MNKKILSVILIVTFGFAVLSPTGRPAKIDKNTLQIPPTQRLEQLSAEIIAYPGPQNTPTAQNTTNPYPAPKNTSTPVPYHTPVPTSSLQTDCLMMGRFDPVLNPEGTIIPYPCELCHY